MISPPRVFDESAFNDALDNLGRSVYSIARRARMPMFRMRRLLKGLVPIVSRRLAVAKAMTEGEVTTTQNDLWPIDD